MLERGTINGYADDSTWARGQAWAIHGLVSAHRATGDYREEAERAARWFLDRVDGVPPWDFDAPRRPRRRLRRRDRGVRAPRSRLRRTTPGALAAAFPLNPATATACSCTARTACRSGTGLDCATVWGDFFALETLLRLEGGRAAPLVEL